MHGNAIDPEKKTDKTDDVVLVIQPRGPDQQSDSRHHTLIAVLQPISSASDARAALGTGAASPSRILSTHVSHLFGVPGRVGSSVHGVSAFKGVFRLII